jgi:DNA-methyltransferase (dcm)
MMNLNESQKIILDGWTFCDLFAGIGAFRMALESFGARCVFSSEWDADAQETYRMNYGETPAGDITKINEHDIPDHDILCAGFPCQPFSISGKMLGFQDTRGTLFFDVARIAECRRPKIILLENVKNFITHDGGRTLKVVLKTLDDIGYDAFPDIYNAFDYGVPQKRERLFIICFRKDLGIVLFSRPEGQGKCRHVEDVLLPEKEVEKYVIHRSDIVMKNGVTETHSISPLRLGQVNKGGQGERIYSPMGAGITLSAYGGGPGGTSGLYLINGRVRRLAPRECARLDGLPDSFWLPSKDSIAYRQLGNSIVVDVIQSIILGIYKTGAFRAKRDQQREG